MEVKGYDTLTSNFISSGCTSVSVSATQDRPDVVLTHPELGVISISLSDELPEIEDRIRQLNRQVTLLRSHIPEVELMPLHRIIVSKQLITTQIPLGSVVLLTSHEFEEMSWMSDLPRSDLNQRMLEAVASKLQPQHLQFIGKARIGATDSGAADRAVFRFSLDAAQASAAQRDTDDVLLISGPPGSGKTLVLVARARWLSTNHPDWTIVVLVYNRLLAQHLRHLLRECPNVEVFTFGSFTQRNGHKVSIRDEERAKSDVVEILKQDINPTVDALLIDEWQDFFPAWITYAFHLLRKGHGGACLAGDGKQAIYRHEPPFEALRSHQIERVVLERPYRSTRQIFEVVGRLNDSFITESAGSAPEGQPVDLIRADDWNGQAKVIAWEVRKMLDSGERLPEDIGILMTQNIAIKNRLVEALSKENIPHSIIDGSQLPDPSRVSVITVHQSKGYEFDVVILMGLEALPKPTDDPEKTQRCRVGFVGPTRARDQLLITYTRANEFLRNLRDCGEDILRVWNFPEDYEVI